MLRFRNFLRDGARYHIPCCVKGPQSFVPAILKTFSKKLGIGDRTHRGSNPPGLELGTYRGSNRRGRPPGPGPLIQQHCIRGPPRHPAQGVGRTPDTHSIVSGVRFKMRESGIEPATFGSEDRRHIHTQAERHSQPYQKQISRCSCRNESSMHRCYSRL